MPASLNVNWTEIMAKFMAGMTVTDIARTYQISENAVYKRAHRCKWTKPHIRHATKLVERSMDAIVAKRLQEAVPAIDQAVKAWTDKAHSVAGQLVARVASKVDETEDAEDLQRLAGTLERADTVGRRALGLDRDAPSGPAVVNIAIGLAYRPSATSGGLVMDYASATDAQVVEVEPASDPVN